MKKFLSIVLALAMIMAMSTTVFAAETSVPKESSQNINATYTAATNGSVTNNYYFTITWGDVTAAAYDGGTVAYKWDAENMKYVVDAENSTAASWTDGSVSVTVESKSDKPLTLTPSVSWSSNEGTSTMKKGGADVTTVTLESAARTAEGNAFTATTGDQAAAYDSTKSAAQSATIDFTITPAGTIDAAVPTIATVTISVAAA